MEAPHWWLVDKIAHRRGPLNCSQAALLLHIGSVSDKSQILSTTDNIWSTIGSCERWEEALATNLGDDNVTEVTPRLALSDVPQLESMPCQDPTCPSFPGCDVTFLWDRKSGMWLTFDEYVQVCTEDGLTDGLPDRLLPQTADQVHDLLLQADNPHSTSKVASRIKKSVRNPMDSPDEDEPLSDPEKEAKRQKRRAYRDRKKLKRDAGLWIKARENPNVYLSSLPLDVTRAEVVDLFKQAGQIKPDLHTSDVKVKMYGNGDALVSYMHVESVGIAVDRFDQFEIRPGCVISVQPADFTPQEAHEGTASKLTLDELREKAQMNKENRKKLLEFYRRERKLRDAWDVTEAAPMSARPVVVFQNCFDPHVPVDYDYLESELENMCCRFGGIKKVKAIKDSFEGYICVKFEKSDFANLCCTAVVESPFELQGRPLTSFIHDGRDLTSHLYTATTSVDETTDQVMAAEVEWEEFLYDPEVDSDDEDLQIRTE